MAKRTKYAREWYRKNKERIRTPEYIVSSKENYDKWRRLNPERLHEIQKKYYTSEKGRATMRKNNSLYKKNNKEKVNARTHSRRIGQRKEECSWCATKDKLNFHHTSYEKRTGFTLCHSCHKLEHSGMMLGGVI